MKRKHFISIATRALFVVLLAGVMATVTAQSASAREEIENVAAFARLYGVVRYFYPSDAAAALDWNRFAVYGVSRVRGARDRRELEKILNELFAALGPGIVTAANLPAAPASGSVNKSPVAWVYDGPDLGRRTNDETAAIGAHTDFDLTSGLKARVPLALTDTEARTEPKSLETLRASLNALAPPAGHSEIDIRLADVVVAWNVFRHFYPYWPETQVDWNARLRPQLEIAYAAAANTREAHRDVLRALVADARDGHGLVTEAKYEPAFLPIYLTYIEGQLVITGTGIPEQAPIGSVVTAIDGIQARARFEREKRLASGSPQWHPRRAVWSILSCNKGSVVRMNIKPPGAAVRETALTCNATAPQPETRVDAITELEPGIWYVNLTRAKMDQIRPELEKLAHAKGIVFDLRGYPTDAGDNILPYLIDQPESDRWMHTAKITGPFGQVGGWRSAGWNLKPAAPHLAAKRVFLTNSRAISYAESVMGYMADHKLATIIGSRTAGTNGNVSTFEVPSGFKIAFTGVRVTRHDGRTPFHLVGVKPDIPLEPTLAGIRAGRDELLERALAVIRAQKN